ncbi:MAG: YjbF family lipoprotein [Rubellimicrobium sp.]|nr:YjbF family lipoprotein [Rubellimicrobium sp.]
MKWTLLAAAALLTACSNGQTNFSLSSLPGASIIGAIRGGDRDHFATTEIETPGFTAQAIADNPENFMIVDVPNIGLNQPARIVQKNGPDETWAAQSGATFAFHDGVMVATRGLIDDLLTLSGAGVRNALAAGGGTVTRTLERLDDLDRLSTLVLTCTITGDGPEVVNLGLREAELAKFTEHCASPALVFDNAYWLDPEGRIIASRQLVSPGVGYARLNRL